MTMKKEVVGIEEVAVEEFVTFQVGKAAVGGLVTFQVAKTPIKIGEQVCCTADIAELAVLMGLTARQMLKLLNKNLIRGVCWNKEANDGIEKIRHYMAEFEVCGFTTYFTAI